MKNKGGHKYKVEGQKNYYIQRQKLSQYINIHTHIKENRKGDFSIFK